MTDLDRQIEYWDRVANAKTFSHPLDLPLLHRYLSSESRVLDYGCGYGRLAEELIRGGYRNILGVDVSSQMIERGRRKSPALELRVVRGRTLPFEDTSFDLVLLFAVLTSIPTDEGQREVIREVERVLSPDGFLYVSDYPLQDDEKNCLRYRTFQEKYGTYGVFELPGGGVMRHHDPTWIEELLWGFDRLSYMEIPVTTMNRSSAKGFQFFGKKKRSV